MNRRDAKKIAEDITRAQLLEMFKSAKTGITDWTRVSDVNLFFTKGAAWNRFYPVLMSCRPLPKPSRTNMVHEFGDFLPDNLKPKKEPSTKKPHIEPLHEEPNFGVR